MKKSDHEPVEFGGKAFYRIVVRGSVAENWSNRLAGMSVDTQTTMAGVLRDQSELNGVLATLHSLHLPIVRVECLEVEDDD